MDVWVISLNIVLPEALPLSTEEQERAWKLLPASRPTFIASHYARRCILASYLNTTPEQIEFASAANGKPSIRGAAELRFSVAHSADVALCAVAWERDVGADIELVRAVDQMESLVSAHFALAEARQFSLLATDAKQAAFFALWTRKEAFVKAIGEGLRCPLNRFEAPLEAAGIEQRLPITETDARKHLDWSLFSFCPAAGYLGAVVVSGADAEPPTIHHFP